MSGSGEQKKLTLKSSTGGRDFSSAKKSVTVEVKRKRTRPLMGFGSLVPEEKETAPTPDQQTTEKLNLIKKAREESKARSKEKAKAKEAAESKSAEQPPKAERSQPEIHKESQRQDSQKKPANFKGKSAEEDEEESAGSFSKKLSLKQPVKKNKYDFGGRKNSSKIIIQNIDFDEDNERGRSLASIKRAREKAARKAAVGQESAEKIIREVTLPEFITVAELASRMAERGTDVVKEFMKLGMMVNLQQTVDADTAELVVSEMGHKVKRVTEADVENILEKEDKDSQDLMKPRPPVVTVMGHVDHGKTTLLDALRSTDVAAGETGGITQHIGAYQVTVPTGEKVTFLDTPGHEAFTQMRSRGAKATDIVVLVVAAEDGIKPQTIEAINHAKAANVPIIVAINKIDKPEANPTKVTNELLSHDIVTEAVGGDVIAVEVSAKNKINLDKLVEAILLQAEMLDLKANPDRKPKGIVVESKVDKGRGVVATVLVQKGTLHIGDIMIAGHTFGKIRIMTNDKNQTLKEALPSMPVEVIGLEDTPMAGDQFDVVDSEKHAREICEYRTRKIKNERTAKVKKTSLEDLFAKTAGQNTQKELPILIKADVQGSIEAIAGSLEKFENEELKIKILHKAVGGINESDVTLAQASGAIIVGFNVRTSNQAKALAEKEKVDIRYYSIIYDLIDDMKLVMSGMLKPILREKHLGTVEIRQVFNISKVGKIAGSFVTEGVIKRGAKVRLLRDDVVIHEGTLKTLKRFKDDVKEVKSNYECGIAFENYNDIKEGDKVEVFELIEERKTL